MYFLALNVLGRRGESHDGWNMLKMMVTFSLEFVSVSVCVCVPVSMWHTHIESELNIKNQKSVRTAE